METIEYNNYDKSEWKQGEWQNEPDKVQFEDEATEYPCLIVRAGPERHLCGYVGVDETHPLFDVYYDDAPNFKVHGGLTYSDFCMEGHGNVEEEGICHLPAEGETDRVWWFGFDCNHSGDHPPLYADDHEYIRNTQSSYKNIDYVKSNCSQLAQQLMEVKEAAKHGYERR